MNNERDSSRPGAGLLLPIMCHFIMCSAWLLEAIAALGHFASGGKWPAPLKVWVITGIAVATTVYKLKLPKRHLTYIYVLRDANLTRKEVAWVLCLVVSFGVFVAWLAVGPPGPEFMPK